MILIYLVNTKLEFLENSYSDKGRRIGTLIEEAPGRWGFWAERASVGITPEQMSQITMEMVRLSTRSIASGVPHNPSEDSVGYKRPETLSDASGLIV